MQVEFIAGFGPVVQDAEASLDFWSAKLGIAFEQPGPGYFHTETLQGAKAFALWPLSQAAESTFGTPRWPDEHPVPQAWIELDVASPAAVGEAAAELTAQGCTLLREAHDEPWGQTTARLLSPEHLLVGISYTSWMHEGATPS